jgi:hypothetical protein
MFISYNNILAAPLWYQHKLFNMKNHILALFTIISIGSSATFVSCTDKSSEDDILATKIQYDVPVNNNDPQLDWWINNLEGSRRDPFLKRIMEAAEKGEVSVFDYFGQPLSPAQIASAANDTSYLALLRDSPPYEEYDTMVVTTITYRDISKIRFLEEWKWDPKSLEMEKKVMAIGPVVQKEAAGGTYNQLLFWIYFDGQHP